MRTHYNSLRLILPTLAILACFLLPSSANASELRGTVKATSVTFSSGRERIYYTFHQGQNSYNLIYSRHLKEQVSSNIGNVVNVQGWVFWGRYLYVWSVEEEQSEGILQSTRRAEGEPIRGDSSRKIAVVLTSASPETDTCTKEALAEIMYEGDTNVRELFEESSFSQFTLNSDANGDGAHDIFGPLDSNTLPAIGVGNIVGYLGRLDRHPWIVAIDNILGDQLAAYDNVIYIAPDGQPIGVGGIADLSGRVSIVAGCTRKYVFAHELGHNFGLLHASLDYENDGRIDLEYGDNSCIMGVPGPGENPNVFEDLRPFNAPHKEQLGWFDNFPGSIVRTDRPGTFTISTLDKDPTSVGFPQIVKTAIPDTGVDYYFSFRGTTEKYAHKGTWANRLSIHRYRRPINWTSRSDTSSILPLDIGETMVDQVNGIEARVVSQNGETLTFELVIPSPWQNKWQREDVNLDGEVTTLDALLILNARRRGVVLNSQNRNQPPFYDVNGDHEITTLDALIILNYIKRQRL
jgi:hypothetical protein